MPFLATIGSTLFGGAATGVGTTAAAGTTGGFSFSSVLSAGSAILGGIAEFQASKFQASVAKANATIAENNAKRALQEGQLKQQEQDDLTAAFLGEQLAKQGASGVAVSSTSSTRARSTARRLGRTDSLRIRDAAAFEATDFRNQSAQFSAQAKQLNSQAGFGLLAGFAGATGSLIGRAAPTRRSSLRRFAT